MDEGTEDEALVAPSDVENYGDQTYLRQFGILRCIPVRITKGRTTGTDGS